MDRRQFIRVCTSTIGVVSVMQPRLAYAQPGNPKVYLYGMFLIENSGTAIKVQIPQVDGMDQHRAFMAASTATVKSLGGQPIAISAQNGLDLIHSDCTVAKYPTAMILQQNNLSFTGGTAPTVVQQSLLNHLPSLSAISAQAGGQARSVKMPSGSFEISLSGGQLRLPQTRSNCQGADPAVTWDIAVNGTGLGAMPLTDMCVYESGEPTLTITVGTTHTASLKAGDAIWIFNLPLLKPVDKTPQQIEHISEWESLLDPPLAPGTLKATTQFKLAPAKGRGPFNHPNLTSASVRQSANAHFQKHYPGIFSTGYPPDSDLCVPFRRR